MHSTFGAAAKIRVLVGYLAEQHAACGTQPILGAMDSMAAHSDGYSPRRSCTILTARSRTSGENLFDSLMAQSSQSV